MTERSYSLDAPLPREIQPSSGSSYFRYPVFGWQWYWRRATVYGPLGVVFGAAIAVRAGMDIGDWSVAWNFALRTVPAWVGIMLVGPYVAFAIRRRSLPRERERRLLVATVFVSICASFMAKAWYESYYVADVWPLLKAQGKGASLLPGMVLNSIDTIAWKGSFYDMFYRAFYAIVILLGSGGYGLVLYFREGRRWYEYRAKQDVQTAREQRDAADRTLAILQAQVEPHFLYNTMASVRSLVRADPARAEATIDALVDHLRATLPKFRDSHVDAPTLADQMEICRSYLEVMRVRMGGRLTYSVDVPADLIGLGFPPLMLISLVENAIKHGVEPKPGACVIAISAHRATTPEGDSLYVSVVDDGAGLREGPSEGVGLANIRAQLATRYGNRSSLQLQSREGGGTVATIRIPVEQQT